MASPPSNEPNKIPSNEQVIEEITKNVCEGLSVENESKEEPSVTQSNSKEDQKEDFKNSDEDEEQNIIADDFVNEEELKNLEVDLTEEEKSERHKKALEFKNQGNLEFKNQKYTESISSYTEGLRICPLQFDSDRAILYANRGASKVQLDRKTSAIEDCSKAIELNDKYIRAYLRRAKLYEDVEKLDESLADYNKILELDPGNKDAIIAQTRLPPLINERNEKLKTEMLGKLKDLGNTILRPFGLSTDNFKINQDPNSGGYSINFQN